MGSLQEQNISLWVGTTPETAYPPLQGDLHVDVAVIGGGIAGLSIAARLVQAGVRVAVLEADRIAAGATGYTTAKVTSQHSLLYHDLTRQAGAGLAKQYADANEAAIAEIARLSDTHGITCDFRRGSAHVYTTEADQIDRIQQEVEAAVALGLPAEFVASVELPFAIAGAVRFRDQAMFHPRKYCLGLAEAIARDGCQIFEQTRVTDVTCNHTCTVTTETGTVTADHVVLATQLPILDEGLFATRTSPARSYAMAVRFSGPVPDDMYISMDEPTRSLRPHAADGQQWLIVGGEGHKVGQDPDTEARYRALEQWAGEHFDVQAVDYRWSAQDYMAVDHVPFIGPISRSNERVLVATGFNKWGMTTGVVAGMILTDRILGQPSPWSEVFSSNRADIGRSAKPFLIENANVAKRFVGDRIRTLVNPDIESLAPGEGGVVNADGEKVAAYRDDAGRVYAVSPVCTHLGCLVTFNTAERSWDCPCHGSRFDIDGQVLQGPAVTPLAPAAVSEVTPPEA